MGVKVLTQPDSKTMSREAVKRVEFLGKPPTSRHEFRWILQIADRLTDDRPPRKSPPKPRNLIPFPGAAADSGGSSWK